MILTRAGDTTFLIYTGARAAIDPADPILCNALRLGDSEIREVSPGPSERLPAGRSDRADRHPGYRRARGTEPVSTVALGRFVTTHSVVRASPTAVSLRAFPTISREGDRNLSQQAVRSMILELCAFHGPDHLQVAVVTANPDNESWNLVKWRRRHSMRRRETGACRARVGRHGHLFTLPIRLRTPRSDHHMLNADSGVQATAMKVTPIPSAPSCYLFHSRADSCTRAPAT